MKIIRPARSTDGFFLTDSCSVWWELIHSLTRHVKPTHLNSSTHAQSLLLGERARTSVRDSLQGPEEEGEFDWGRLGFFVRGPAEPPSFVPS